MTKKFGFLRFIAGVYKVFGIILMIAAVVGAIAVMVTGILGGNLLPEIGGGFYQPGVNTPGGVVGGIATGLVTLIVLGLSAVTQFAISEAIMVFLTIEENTRATASLLSRKA